MFFNGQITRTIESYHLKNEAFPKPFGKIVNRFPPQSICITASFCLSSSSRFEKLCKARKSRALFNYSSENWPRLNVRDAIRQSSHYMPHQSEALISPLAGKWVFQNNDLCWQAFPFPPPPTPLLHFLFHNSFHPPPSLHFSLVPISCAAKLSKSRSSVFLCSENPQKRLLRRLGRTLMWNKRKYLDYTSSFSCEKRTWGELEMFCMDQ